jgi:hypothetical protein
MEVDMFVELQDRNARELMYQAHGSMIEGALVIIFEFDQKTARDAVDALTRRYADVPVATRNVFVHEDPVKIAAEIAGKPATALEEEPYASLVKRYNAEVRTVFEKRGAWHSKELVKPAFEKLVSQR